MTSRTLRSAASLCLLLLGGCYGFSGGGGLPSNVKTAYVAPVENRTSTQFVLTEQVTNGLLDAVRNRLGLQLASESNADALIKATITGYSDQALNYQAQQGVGAQVFRRQIRVSASVEIVDTRSDQIIWRSASVTGTGEYAPDTESEDVGRQLAVENLIQQIVDGAQSQW